MKKAFMSNEIRYRAFLLGKLRNFDLLTLKGRRKMLQNLTFSVKLVIIKLPAKLLFIIYYILFSGDN